MPLCAMGVIDFSLVLGKGSLGVVLGSGAGP